MFSASRSAILSRVKLAIDDLTQPMKVNALEGALVEEFPDRFPSFTTVHQCTQVSISVGT